MNSREQIYYETALVLRFKYYCGSGGGGGGGLFAATSRNNKV